MQDSLQCGNTHNLKLHVHTHNHSEGIDFIGTHIAIQADSHLLPVFKRPRSPTTKDFKGSGFCALSSTLAPHPLPPFSAFTPSPTDSQIPNDPHSSAGPAFFPATGSRDRRKPINELSRSEGTSFERIHPQKAADLPPQELVSSRTVTFRQTMTPVTE